MSPSMASRIWLIKVASSLGSSTSSYAGRSATVTALSVVTVVVGSRAASTCSAASCGVRGISPGFRSIPVRLPGVMVLCSAVWSRLDQIHRSLPLLITSVSP